MPFVTIYYLVEKHFSSESFDFFVRSFLQFCKYKRENITHAEDKYVDIFISTNTFIHMLIRPVKDRQNMLILFP